MHPGHPFPVNPPQGLAVQGQCLLSTWPVVAQPFPQHRLKGVHVQVFEHPVEGGYAGRLARPEPQELSRRGSVVPSPLGYGVQAAGAAQHGANGQAQNCPQRVTLPLTLPVVGHQFQRFS